MRPADEPDRDLGVIDAASAPLPKFVIHRSTFRHELRKQRGTSNSMILVPLFDLKFLTRVCGNCCRNFKSAALAGGLRLIGQPAEAFRLTENRQHVENAGRGG